LFHNIKLIEGEITTREKVIIDSWLSAPLVQEVFYKTQLSEESFRKSFAPNIIKYFLGVANKESPIGECPVMLHMLEVFEALEITPPDVFMICTHLKIAMIKELCPDKMNHETIDEISFILDSNLYGILQYFCQKEKICSI